ncbi:TPA: hypothetical protein DCW61_01940 [Candidatus Uhrbacteria bacterium]|nr:hypothetical protein [Candidatus Uhrbacteria bacterium]
MIPHHLERNEKEDESLKEVQTLLTRHADSFNTIPRPGFKEALKARILEARQHVSMPRFSSLFSSGLFKKMAPLGLSLGVLLIIFMMVFQPFFHTNIVSAAELILTAENSDSLGVDPQSTFLLESKENLDIKAVQEQLKIQMEHNVPFTLEQIDAKKIRLAFEEPLSPNELLGVTLNQVQTTQNGETQERPYQWAFQVKETFRVLATTPGNRESYAPVETGVEVVFSHQHIDLKKFEQAFHIEPKVNGIFTSQDRSFAFVPEKLEPGTVYTVTIDKSLRPEGSEETLQEDYIFSFETNPNSLGWFEFSVAEHYVTVSPSSTVTIPYHANGETHNEQGNPQSSGVQSPLHVKLSQFLPQENQSAYEQFVEANRRAKSLEWRVFTATDELLNTSTLTPVSEFDAQKVNASWENYFLFPESLEEGYYFAQVSFGDRQTWLLIASSPLTAYVAKANNQTLVWVNDALTKQAIAGADVRLLDYGTSATTDQEGLGTIRVSAESSTQDYLETEFLEVKQDNHAILLTLTEPYVLYGNKSLYEGKRGVFSQPSSEYWSYLYTDRPMYQTTDTLKLWGYLEKRSTGERPSQIHVWIGQKQWCDYSMSCTGERPVIFDETLLSVNKEGTFEGTLDIDQMPPGYYQVTTEVNGEEISSRGINVSEYTKPAYTLTLTPDTKAVFAGEPVEFTVQAEFFEGTPVKGLEVDVNTQFEQKTLILDETGTARGSVSFSYQQLQTQESTQRFPTYQWISIKPHRPEEGQIESNTYVMVFGPHVYIDIPWNQATSKEGQGEVTFTTRNVEPIDSWDPSLFGSNVLANQLVSGEVIEITYVSREVGSSYDFISKKVIKQYTYDRQEKKILDFTVTTDAQGKGTYRFDTPNKNANYEVHLSSADSSGLVDKATSYVWIDQSFKYGQDTALHFKNPEIDANPSFQGYDLGQTVHLSVEQNWKPFVPESTGRFLYFKAQNGIQETHTSSSPDYEFSYEAKDIPNVDIYGVYFNGEAYAKISGNSSVSFDTSSHELKVNISQDKTQYRPGEEVTLFFDVHDADNQPVAAQLNINVVDEAFYALASEEVNPLRELFHFVESGVLVTQTSEQIKQSDSMAEGGGGGDRGRFVFKDTALFKTIQTDTNGKGTLTFTLPDNITSWRVTAQALETNQKLAGKKTTQVAATLPFFIQPTLQKSYLKEDRPIILLRANGTDVDQTQPVTYSVKIGNQETEQTITSTIGETAHVSLPELPLGKIEITIHGETQQASDDEMGVLTDTITRSINVVSSRLTKSTISTYRLNDYPTLSGSTDDLTWVTFIDGNQGRYYGELSSLSYQSGERVDQAVTRMLARELLNQTFNETEIPSSFSPSVYQGQGIRLFPYSSESIELTAQIALLQEIPFDKEAMKIALRNQLFPSLSSQPSSLTTREIAQVYAALATLGEPVLAQTQQFLTTPDLGVEEQLYGSLALLYSGHKEGARMMYKSLIEQTTKEQNSRWLPADSKELQGKYTALLAVLSSGLNEPEADELYSAVITKDHGETLLAVEQFLFIKNRLQNLPIGSITATYYLEGEQHTVSLEKGESFSIALTQEELQALQPETTKGEVMLVTRSTKPFTQEESDVQENLLLTRSYYSQTNPTQTFKEGDLVKIKLQFDIPTSDIPTSETQTPETFELVDLLPSGLEVITPTLAVYQSDMRDQVCQSYPTQVKDQQISFFVSNDTGWNSAGCELHTVVYYARVVTPGTYLSQPAMMSSITNPEIYTLSDSSSLTIGQ